MDIQIATYFLEHWPKLAWVAEWQSNTKKMNVSHGPMVEIRDKWIAEAVWGGDFDLGDFDKTDIVFGSGIRLRENRFVFVSSGSMFDRLLYVKRNNETIVSNTLPGILAVSGLKLRNDYQNYSLDAVSMVNGLENRIKKIPTTSIPISSVYFNNIIIDCKTGALVEEPKPDTAPNFTSYSQYKDFLFRVAKKLGNNATDISRKNPISLLSGISSGYDSAVASVVAKEAGCRNTVTISKASSLWGKSDSGAHIAKRLGLSCIEYPRQSKNYPNEIALWAGEGRPGILNWTLFEYPEPLCLFFTGCHGEKVWDRVNHDHPDPFVRRDSSSHAFCEYRLWRGVFQCPVPFFGIRHSMEIRAITENPEMAPWYMNKDYDKPIPRRILEEAGVDRAAFGTANKNTSLETAFRWPFSKDAQVSFNNFLKGLGIRPPSRTKIKIIRTLLGIYHLFYLNIGKSMKWKYTELISKKIKGYELKFVWANEKLREEYEKRLFK